MDGADCLGVEEFWKRLAGEETEGRKSSLEITAFGDGFEGKTGGNRRMRFG